MKLVKKIALSTEEILNRVSEYDIYRYYFGQFTVNRKTVNHLRGDKTAGSFLITMKYSLFHMDFADEYWRGNCFNLVQQIYNCDFHTALAIIDRDLGLGISSGEISNEKIVTWKQPQVIEKSKTLIQVEPKRFNKKELDYWEEYCCGEEDLKNNNIVALSKVYINKARIRIYEDNLCFGYFYPDTQKWKLYCPNNPIINGISWKWRTNCDFDYVENLEKINDCKIAFISKSRKDRIIITKALETECIITVQSENYKCLNINTLDVLKHNSNKQVTIFDADAPGKKNSILLTELYGFHHCNVPDKYISKGIKDFSDLAKRYGLKKITQHFKSKGFI